LYAVVVHIGGNAYHGHYVSIIKTKDRGWVLFDDEMVEPVDSHFVRNFFGDKPGMATAYVLFYQETTFEKVRQEQEKDGMEEVLLASQAANVASEEGLKDEPVHLKRQATQPITTIPENDSLDKLAHASTAPEPPTSPVPVASPAANLSRFNTTAAKPEVKSKDDKKREKKEREAAEKAEKAAAKEREKQFKAEEKVRRDDHVKRIQARRGEQEELQKVLKASKKTAAEEAAVRKKDDSGAADGGGTLERSKAGSKSVSKRSFSFFKDKEPPPVAESEHNGDGAEKTSKTKGFSMLGKKKSHNVLSQ
jgi:ubiquitin carboxyl-terminal hydrolase 9/13